MTRSQKLLLYGAGGGVVLLFLLSRTKAGQVATSKAKSLAFGVGDPTDKQIATLAAQMQPIVREFVTRARAAGYPIVITSGRRTMEEQAALYAKGRDADGSIVTNAQPGDSAHNFGLAIDFAFGNAVGRPTWPNDAPWAKVAAIGKALGLEWGGDWRTFKDQPHLELPTWKQARATFKATGKVVA
jgi:hypothetical protein